MAEPAAHPGPGPEGDWLTDLPPRRGHLLLAAGLVAAVYLAGVTDGWWPTPDSALYQGLGRNLLAGEGYRFNGRTNTLVAPGTPAVYGAIGAATGGATWAKNLFAAACGIASLLAAWATLRRLLSARMAFAACLATAGCYAYYDFSHLVLTDAPFALLFWLLAYCGVRCARGSAAWIVPMLAISAAGVLVRAPGIVALGALAGGLALDRSAAAPLGKRLAAAAAALAGGIGAGGLLVLAAGRAAAAAADGNTYVAKYVTNPQMGPLYRLKQVLGGLWNLPGALAEMTLGQGGWPMRIVALGMIVLMVAAAVRLWRRRQRFAPATALLLVLGLAVASHARAVRPRYLMPVHPLLVALLLEGVCEAVAYVRRRRGRATDDAVALRAVTVAVAVLLAVNAPKVFRNAFYYAAYGHMGRYHEVIEHGRYRDLRDTAAFLREHVPPGEPVAMRADRVSMLHYLSGRRTVPFKRVDPYNPWSAEQAEEVHADLRTRPGLFAVVHDRGDLDKRFAGRLTELLEGDPNLRRVWKGPTTAVYRRIGQAATAPATTQAP